VSAAQGQPYWMRGPHDVAADGMGLSQAMAHNHLAHNHLGLMSPLANAMAGGRSKGGAGNEEARLPLNWGGDGAAHDGNAQHVEGSSGLASRVALDANSSPRSPTAALLIRCSSYLPRKSLGARRTRRQASKLHALAPVDKQ
jgi:hypothetical protein